MVFGPGDMTGANDPFSAVCGKSPAIIEVVERLRLAAPLDVHVLLTGPSGVGKTLLANAVHQASRRRTARFVEVSCAAIPESVLESELFGTEPDLHMDSPRMGLEGKVEAAEGGTLFLGDITELPLGAQAKLLQLLQSKTYCRHGGTQPRRADVRVVAATTVNLKAAISAGRFREDLYHRLHLLEARVPTLAERTEDLVLLSLRFLAQATERHQLVRRTLSPSALRAIHVAEWPGNVRELANRIESAAIHAHLRGSEWIDDGDVFPDDELPVHDEVADSLQSATRRFQRKYVLGVLTSTDWNVAETARILEVSRSHVYNLIHAFDLKRD